MPNRSRGRFGKKIDTVHWTGVDGSFKDQAAGSGAVTLVSAQHLPETLLRIRGEWSGCFDSAVGPGIAVDVTLGIIQVPEGTGTTVLWSPSTDADAPWIWWDVFNLFYFEQVTDVIASQEAMSARRVIDSKAMRKIRNTELQLVVENATRTGFLGGTVQIGMHARVLSGS